MKPRPRQEPALASSAWSLSAFVGCPNVLRTARRTSSERKRRSPSDAVEELELVASRGRSASCPWCHYTPLCGATERAEQPGLDCEHMLGGGRDDLRTLLEWQPP